MSVGEPQHEPPALFAETLAAHAHVWNKYPPMQGTPELRDAVADWLTMRYGLPPGAVIGRAQRPDARRHQGGAFPARPPRGAAAQGGAAAGRAGAQPVLSRL